MSMEQKQKNLVYKRDKGKIDLEGPPHIVQKLIWFHEISIVLKWLVLIVFLWVLMPKVMIIPFMMKWLRNNSQ